MNLIAYTFRTNPFIEILEQEFSHLVVLGKLMGFKDHALSGEWSGHRSSYLNDTYRVIYSVEKQMVRVNIVDVNHHDYRRK